MQNMMHMVGPSSQRLLNSALQETQLWHSIRMAAANDPVLKEMMEQVKLYYIMKYDQPWGSK
jgi:hypothetical protein